MIVPFCWIGLAALDAGQGVEASGLALLLLLYQLPAVFLLLSRLMQGPVRRPPLLTLPPTLDLIGSVSVVVPTLNEAHRIAPCLAGLGRQGYEVREILVVDSRSTDGTVDRVKAAAMRDPRFRLITDDPLPKGWVGRPWALHTGFLHSSSRSLWVLGIDADTQPQPGLISSLVQAAEAADYDLVSLSPRFVLKQFGELWLQPALLMTLVYRFGPAGNQGGMIERVMANGQCFLCRRTLLETLDGYTTARSSFCDDVTLARNAAQLGAKVGFWDGSKLLKVRMYEGAIETWREWGRSLDLKDAASFQQTWGDIWFLSAIQALPWLTLPLLLWGWTLGQPHWPVTVALGLNGALIAVRVALQGAIAPSYDLAQADGQQWAFWLSPLADPLATLRIMISALKTPTQWRGRHYEREIGD